MVYVPVGSIRFHPEYNWLHHRDASDGEASQDTEGDRVRIEHVQGRDRELVLGRIGIAHVVAVATNHVADPQQISNRYNEPSLFMIVQ